MSSTNNFHIDNMDVIEHKELLKHLLRLNKKWHNCLDRLIRNPEARLKWHNQLYEHQDSLRAVYVQLQTLADEISRERSVIRRSHRDEDLNMDAMGWATAYPEDDQWYQNKIAKDGSIKGSSL